MHIYIFLNIHEYKDMHTVGVFWDYMVNSKMLCCLNSSQCFLVSE